VFFFFELHDISFIQVSTHETQPIGSN
jgi:hypothetical protein